MVEDLELEAVKKKLRLFYLKYLPPIVLIALFFIFVEISFFYFFFFITTYSWMLALHVPNIDKWISSNKYKLSFIALIYLANQKVVKKIAPQKKETMILTESFLPLLFTVLIASLSDFNGIIFAVLGILVFQSVSVVEKIYLSKIAKFFK